MQFQKRKYQNKEKGEKIYDKNISFFDKST